MSYFGKMSQGIRATNLLAQRKNKGLSTIKRFACASVNLAAGQGAHEHTRIHQRNMNFDINVIAIFLRDRDVYASGTHKTLAEMTSESREREHMQKRAKPNVWSDDGL